MWFCYRLLVASKVQSYSLTLTIYQYTQHWISKSYKLVITFSYLTIQNQHIMSRLLYLLLCLFNYVLFQLYSILNDQYLSSTDAYVLYIFSWCRFRFSASRSRIDRFPISSSADLVVSPHSLRTTVMSVISVISDSVSIFARFSWCLSQYFESI